MKFLCILLLGILSFHQAHANKEVGNGGNAVYCLQADGSVSHVMILDYYELANEWNLTLNLGAANLDPITKVKIALERARRYHPQTADQLELRADGFFADANLLSGVDLTPVDDADEHFLPKDCSLKQVAVQRAKQFPQDRTFLINKDVWDLLDNDQKAGLILHEIIFEKALRSIRDPNAPRADSVNSRMSPVL